MELFPWVHEMISIGPWIIAMGPWNDFHWYMEVFPWVHGKVSVGHRAQLYSLQYFRFLGVVARVSEQGFKGTVTNHFMTSQSLKSAMSYFNVRVSN